MVETVVISALGHSGDGIVETPDGRLFVPYTLPGETVEVEERGNRAAATRIVSPSPLRINPICRHFGICGGCALQHMAFDAYLAWKRGLVVDAFAREGVAAGIEPIVPLQPGTRRRAVFSAMKTGGGVVLGFGRRASEEIVAIDECPVLVPAIARRLATLRAIADIALKPKKRARIVVVAADNGLDISVEGGRTLGRAELDGLGGLAADPALARLTVDGGEVFVNRRPEIALDGASLLPIAGGFVQAAATAERVLAGIVVAHVGDASPVADLFAGIGTFALRLARRAPVTAVEGDAALLAALAEGRRRASGLKTVTTRRRDLFANPLAPIELNAFGAVVFDPPAAGARAQAEALAASTVARVAAVSCNPATLARDAAILVSGGYRLTRVVPVDQFVFSAGVEAVATFER